MRAHPGGIGEGVCIVTVFSGTVVKMANQGNLHWYDMVKLC